MKPEEIKEPTPIAKRCCDFFETLGMSARSIEKRIGSANASIYQWSRGRGTPSAQMIANIAREFDINSDYLLCLTDEIENTKYDIFGEANVLSDDVRLIVDAYKKAPAEKRFKLITYMSKLGMID